MTSCSQICVNDDLVAKKFAVYDSQLAAGRQLDELEQQPLMLPSSLLTQTPGPTPPSTPQVSGATSHHNTHASQQRRPTGGQEVCNIQFAERRWSVVRCWSSAQQEGQ